MDKKNRVEWIDIARALGIFAIYLGHLGDEAGHANTFVYLYHVPLFFFISGCMSNYDDESVLSAFVFKKLHTILLPFYGFALVSLGMQVIIYNSGIWILFKLFISVVKGCIRNTYFAGSLWFLSCLFVMEIVFKFLKLLKKKCLILLVCVVIFFINSYFCHDSSPSLIYNIDSLYYIIYYAIGYCLYPYLCELFEFRSALQTRITSLIFLFSMIYSVLLFFGKDILFEFLPDTLIMNMIISVIRALLIISLILILSRFLCGMKFLGEIGKNTLYLCGNEWIIKTVFTSVLSVFGCSLVLSNPLVSYVYVAVLLYVAVKFLIPFEKRNIEIIKNNVSKLNSWLC